MLPYFKHFKKRSPNLLFLFPTVCNCGGGPCDSVTGECLEEGFEPPTGCDKCIWDLIDDLRLAALSIEESKSGLLSVSSGAAAHRHVNELNSTIYLLKVCSHVVPSAVSHAGFARSVLELLSPLSSESHGCYYRWIVRLGNYETLIITMNFNLNQRLPSIKEVKVLNKITKTRSIYLPNY